MQSTTQEVRTLESRPRRLRGLADVCEAKITYYNNRINESENSLEDPESRSFYRMTPIELQGMVDFFTEVAGTVAAAMEHSDHVERLLDERIAILDMIQAEEALSREARDRGDDEAANVHRGIINRHVDDLSRIYATMPSHSDRSNEYLRNAEQRLELYEMDIGRHEN
jgi:hypothetical protein